MAYFGLSKPIIAKRVKKGESWTYEKGFQCGKAISTDVTPNYNEASLYADNELAEYVKEFKDADVTLGVSTLPILAASTMFGHTVEENAITYGADDTASDCGYGFYASEKVDGDKKYIACWLPVVTFTEAAEAYETKGDSMAFKNPSLAGKARADENKNWKYKETFGTEDEAVEWLKGKANITENTVSE